MKKIKLWSCLTLLAISLSFVIPAYAQPSNSASFTMIQAAIATGGGRSTSASFTLTGTVGQASAGTTSSGTNFSLSNGFWQHIFSPTAAAVSISGKVVTQNGQGIPRTSVLLTNQLGVLRYATTNQFGYFQFNGIEAGQVVILTASSKGFEFSPQIFTITENINGITIQSIAQTEKR